MVILLYLHNLYCVCVGCMQWYQKFTEADDVIPISAKFGHGVPDIKDWIISKLPVGPAYYPKACTMSFFLHFFFLLLFCL